MVTLAWIKSLCLLNKIVRSLTRISLRRILEFSFTILGRWFHITTHQLVNAMIYAFGYVSVELHNCEKFYNLKYPMRLQLTIVDLSR